MKFHVKDFLLGVACSIAFLLVMGTLSNSSGNYYFYSQESYHDGVSSSFIINGTGYIYRYVVKYDEQGDWIFIESLGTIENPKYELIDTLRTEARTKY